MSVRAEVDTTRHAGEGLSVLQPQPTVGSFDLILNLIRVSFRRYCFIHWTENRRQDVHSLFDLSLLAFHRQSELSHSFRAGIFTTVVVHRPRTTKTIRSAACFRIKTWGRKKDMEINKLYRVVTQLSLLLYLVTGLEDFQTNLFLCQKQFFKFPHSDGSVNKSVDDFKIIIFCHIKYEIMDRKSMLSQLIRQTS